MYDPHLAPYIEAFIAAHTTRLPHVNRSHQHDPIPVPVHAAQPVRASARQDRATELRRRHNLQQREQEHELREPLLHGDRRDCRLDGAESEFDASRVDRAHPFEPAQKDSIDRKRLVDLDRPTSPQDAEIREIIFHHHTTQPPTPRPFSSPPSFRPASVGSAQPRSSSPSLTPGSMSGWITRTSTPLATVPPASPSLDPTVLSPANHRDRVSRQALTPFPVTPTASLGTQTYPESTAFSFLSLSQVSSPEAPHAMLHSLTFGSAALIDEVETETGDWADISRAPSRSVGRDEDEVRSLPDTTATGHEEVVYSSTAQNHPVQPSPSAVQPFSSLRIDALGVFAHESSVGEVEHSQPRAGGGLRRGPMSVISLSESEGWEGESDW